VNGFLLDTHVWIWHLMGHESLAPTVRQLIDAEDSECWLSPISIWETGILREKRRLAIGEELRSWVEVSLRKLPLRPAALTAEVALRTFELNLQHRDPADRMLAATADVYGLTLITADHRLLESPSVTTLAARS
jgi:PIN domain nuclease of toxin-antitoxin system